MAEYINKSAWHLASNPDLYDPVRSNNFEFVVTGLGNLLRPGVTEDEATDSDYISQEFAQEVLRCSVKASTVPQASIGVIEVNRGNTKVKFAGTISFSAGSLKLVDYIGAQTKDILIAWKHLAGDEDTERVHEATNYKKEGWLYEYTPDYSKVVRKCKLFGCWISDVDDPEHNYDSTNSARELSATLQFDKAIWYPGDYEVK